MNGRRERIFLRQMLGMLAPCCVASAERLGVFDVAKQGRENVSLKLSLAPNLVAQLARRIAERASGRQAAFRVPQLVELGHYQ